MERDGEAVRSLRFPPREIRKEKGWLHFLLSFHVNLTLSVTKHPRTIIFRNIKNVNPDTVSSHINSLLYPHTFSHTDDLITHYNLGLHSILNTVAPQITKTVSFTHSAPWYTPELRQIKTKARQLERLYKKNGLTIHKDMYYNHITPYKDSINHTNQTTFHPSSAHKKATLNSYSNSSTQLSDPRTPYPPISTVLPSATP